MQLLASSSHNCHATRLEYLVTIAERVQNFLVTIVGRYAREFSDKEMMTVLNWYTTKIFFFY